MTAVPVIIIFILLITYLISRKCYQLVISERNSGPHIILKLAEEHAARNHTRDVNQGDRFRW